MPDRIGASFFYDNEKRMVNLPSFRCVSGGYMEMGQHWLL